MNANYATNGTSTRRGVVTRRSGIIGPVPSSATMAAGAAAASGLPTGSAVIGAAWSGLRPSVNNAFDENNLFNFQLADTSASRSFTAQTNEYLQQDLLLRRRQQQQQQYQQQYQQQQRTGKVEPNGVLSGTSPSNISIPVHQPQQQSQQQPHPR